MHLNHSPLYSLHIDAYSHSALKHWKTCTFTQTQTHMRAHMCNSHKYVQGHTNKETLTKTYLEYEGEKRKTIAYGFDFWGKGWWFPVLCCQKPAFLVQYCLGNLMKPLQLEKPSLPHFNSIQDWSGKKFTLTMSNEWYFGCVVLDGIKLLVFTDICFSVCVFISSEPHGDCGQIHQFHYLWL